MDTAQIQGIEKTANGCNVYLLSRDTQRQYVVHIPETTLLALSNAIIDNVALVEQNAPTAEQRESDTVELPDGTQTTVTFDKGIQGF